MSSYVHETSSPVALPLMTEGGFALSSTGVMLSVFGHSIEGVPYVTLERGTRFEDVLDLTIDQAKSFISAVRGAMSFNLRNVISGALGYPFVVFGHMIEDIRYVVIEREDSGQLLEFVVAQAEELVVSTAVAVRAALFRSEEDREEEGTADYSMAC